MDITLTYILIFVGLIIAIAAFIIYKIVQNIKNDHKKINDLMLTKTGEIVILKNVILDEKGMFNFNDGFYNTNIRSKTHYKKRKTFLHIEGLPEPIEIANIKGVGELKIDAQAQKKIIKNKLFDDLFTSDIDKIRDIIILVCVILNAAVSLFIAFKVYAPIPK